MDNHDNKLTHNTTKVSALCRADNTIVLLHGSVSTLYCDYTVVKVHFGVTTP